MKKPQNTTLAVIAAQDAVRYVLNHANLDPFGESHSRLCTAFAYLFSEDINDAREMFGSIPLSSSEKASIYDEIKRKEALYLTDGAPAVTVPPFTVKEVSP